MKRKTRLIVLLLAGIAILSIGSTGTADTGMPPADPTGICAAHPCVTEADCPPGLTCCPNGFCSTTRGCRR